MARQRIIPTGVERFFDDDELIVSKTDLTGRITYANHVFCKIAGYTESELIGQQHSIVRHPDMPRAVFKLLWDTIESGKEIFAYVVNMAKNGDHYWVYAHVTPTFDQHGNIISYHSNRRVPDRYCVDEFKKVYSLLLQEEARHSDARKGMEAGVALLLQVLAGTKMDYEEFVLTLTNNPQALTGAQ